MVILAKQQNDNNYMANHFHIIDAGEATVVIFHALQKLITNLPVLSLHGPE